MSTTINLNFCQKSCVSLNPDNCLIGTIIWTSQNTNIVNVYSNGANAIIRAVYGSIGSAVVSISDDSGVIYVIYVNVTNYSDPVVNPKYQYVHTTSFLVSTPPPNESSGTISGPYTSLIVPFQSNVVSIFMPQSNTVNLYPSSCVFVPGTVPVINIFGFFPGGANFFIGLGIFKPTTNTLIDSKLIFADIINSGNPVSTYTISTLDMAEFLYVTNNPPYCDASNYLVFAMPNISSSSSLYPFVTGSKLLSGGTISIQTQSLNVNTTFNVIVVPNLIYDLSSNDLVYTKIITVTVTNGFNVISIDPIPVGSVVWFVQRYDFSVTNFIGINTARHTTPSVLIIDIRAGATLPGIKLSLIAYKIQSNAGFSAVFP